jgi:hypothetical protein
MALNTGRAGSRFLLGELDEGVADQYREANTA